MRPIKFRGRRLDAPLVYGDLIHLPGNRLAIRTAEGGEWEIRPDSIAQLVGYDSNGNEVYEGDILTAKDGNKKHDYVAMIQAMVYWTAFDNDSVIAKIPKEARTIPIDFIQRFTPITIKEADQ